MYNLSWKSFHENSSTTVALVLERLTDIKIDREMQTSSISTSYIYDPRCPDRTILIGRVFFKICWINT